MERAPFIQIFIERQILVFCNGTNENTVSTLLYFPDMLYSTCSNSLWPADMINLGFILLIETRIVPQPAIWNIPEGADSLSVFIRFIFIIHIYVK